MMMDLESYKESLIGGLCDIDEIEAEIAEMKAAKIGTIKPNCWEKISENEFEICEL